MKIIVTLKSDEKIEINTSEYGDENFSDNFSEVLNNNGNHIFFNNGFDKKMMIMKELIKTIEFVE